MNWMAGNMVVRERLNGRIYMPEKEKNENKIDGMVALLFAISRLMHREEAVPADIVFV
jgi:phage terminase large subunit-like protein